MEIRHNEFEHLKLTEYVFKPKSYYWSSRLKKAFILGGLTLNELNSVNVCRNLIRIFKTTNFIDSLNLEIHILPFINLYDLSQNFNFILSNNPFRITSFPQLDLSKLNKKIINFLISHFSTFDFGLLVLDSYSYYNHKPFFLNLENIHNEENNQSFVLDSNTLFPFILRNNCYVNNICFSINNVVSKIQTTKPMIKIIKNIFLGFDEKILILNLSKTKYFAKYSFTKISTKEAKLDGFWFPKLRLDHPSKNSNILGLIYNPDDNKNYPIRILSKKNVVAILPEKYIKTGEVLCYYKTEN